ncbi:MAG TPA: hypothetical protein DFI01_03440 [Bacteroidales bacterium]|nr:hypothetical protein [Bacteroidales bacterium]
MKSNIFEQITSEIDKFENETIHIADGYDLNTSNLINKITLYINSRFENGQKDSRGRRKFFYNIVLFRRDTTKRLIDIDIKHFRVFGTNTIKQIKAFLCESRFKKWARDSGFGSILNELAEQAATYGSGILKFTGDVIPSVVDIRNLYFDASAENLQKAQFIIEKHLLTPDQLLEKKNDGWKNIDELIDEKDDFIKIYERQGIVPAQWIGKGSGYKKAIFFVAFKKNSDKEGVVLFSQPIEEYQYFDFPLRKQKGRLLGIGDIELLLDLQIRKNSIVNQKASAMEISSKHLFQTTDPNIGGNFLTDYVDGAIIQGQITPVATENRDLNSWVSEENAIDTLADRLAFTYDVVRGESVPATTPATNALIQERQSLSNFALIRQNFGLFLEKIVKNYILPKLLKEFNGEEMTRIIADNFDDLEKADNLFIEEILNDFIYKKTIQTGFVPSEKERQQLKEKLNSELKKGGLVRIIKYGKGYFKDFDQDIIVNVSNESIDPMTELINLQSFLSQISNPAVLQDPLLKRFIYKMAERMGISITDIQLIEEGQKMKEQVMPEGATSIPNIPKNMKGVVPSTAVTPTETPISK